MRHQFIPVHYFGAPYIGLLQNIQPVGSSVGLQVGGQYRFYLIALVESLCDDLVELGHDITFLDSSSTYVPNVLGPLMIIGFAMGTIMPASMQTATLGVDREFAGVASAMVNTSQQVGGSIGTALLNTLAATAAADYLAAHAPVTAAVGVDAAIASYATAYWWSAGFFVFGGILAALLFRRRNQGLSLANAHLPAAEPVLAH